MNERTKEANEKLEQLFALRREALNILKRVVVEWKTDPMSVQCFDLRMVSRAQAVIDEIESLKKELGERMSQDLDRQCAEVGKSSNQEGYMTTSRQATVPMVEDILTYSDKILCPLSDERRHEKREVLESSIREKKRLEGVLKDIQKRHKDLIKVHEVTIDNTLKELEAGEEELVMEVFDEVDEARALVVTKRYDTHAIVKSKPVEHTDHGEDPHRNER